MGNHICLISENETNCLEVKWLPTEDFDKLIQHYHYTVNEFATGNPKPVVALLSRSDDVSLAGGFGGVIQGYEQVAKAIEFAAQQFTEGKVSFDNLSKVVTKNLGYIVEVESYRSKLGGSEDISLDVLRVTSIFRFEDGGWKLVHRHGDPTSVMNALVQLIPKAVVSIKKAI